MIRCAEQTEATMNTLGEKIDTMLALTAITWFVRGESAANEMRKIAGEAWDRRYAGKGNNLAMGYTVAEQTETTMSYHDKFTLAELLDMRSKVLPNSPAVIVLDAAIAKARRAEQTEAT